MQIISSLSFQFFGAYFKNSCFYLSLQIILQRKLYLFPALNSCICCVPCGFLFAHETLQAFPL